MEVEAWDAGITSKHDAYIAEHPHAPTPSMALPLMMSLKPEVARMMKRKDPAEQPPPPPMFTDEELARIAKTEAIKDILKAPGTKSSEEDKDNIVASGSGTRVELHVVVTVMPGDATIGEDNANNEVAPAAGTFSLLAGHDKNQSALDSWFENQYQSAQMDVPDILDDEPDANKDNRS
ncbi:hypothetical protein GUJ93_ZPchr0013g35444 [Zizania palustris]|uniref:Uncharacterized protein n=1 Tax=Zizania palustris TaxID=103762 RepID=A0A8J5X247_ZIZPA|nr:hypothetical protein GUJ93_ZPchr0013g35444 [Zizania palustris]